MLKAPKPASFLVSDPSHDSSYYPKGKLGGTIACGGTHTALTPLDVHMCNMQVNPAKYSTWRSGMGTLVVEEGIFSIYKGWLPTLVGYSVQGMFKSGLYEYFKDKYADAVGPDKATKYKGMLYCASSASAEFFDDIALCPMEMIEVKIQTAPVGTWPTAFLQALSKMIAKTSETRFPFGSLGPLWSRENPYKVAKFYVSEETVGLFYKYWLTRPRKSYSKSTQLVVTFLSGYIAGIVCAAVSHPADNVVSQIGKAENKGKSVRTIVSDVGLVNLHTAVSRPSLTQH